MAVRVEELGNHKYMIHFSSGTGKERIRKARQVTIKQSSKSKEMAIAYHLAEEFDRECLMESEVFSSDVTFEEFAKTWLKLIEPDVEQKTHLFYQKIVEQRLIPAFGDKDMREIRPAQIKAYYNEMLKDGHRLDGKPGALSPNTVHAFHRTLRKMFNDAIMYEVIDKNPVEKLPGPKKENNKAQFLEENELRQVFQHLEKEPYWFNVFVTLSLFSGMRRGEMLGLKWSDYKPEWHLIEIHRSRVIVGKEVVVKGPKTASGVRFLSLAPDIEDMLMKLYEQQLQQKHLLSDGWKGAANISEGYIFVNDEGEPFYPSSPYNKWRSYLEKIGVSHVPLHALRHTAASVFLEHSSSVKAASDRLGHSRGSTTVDIYGHSFVRSAQSLSNEMNNYIKGLLEQKPE